MSRVSLWVCLVAVGCSSGTNVDAPRVQPEPASDPGSHAKRPAPPPPVGEVVNAPELPGPSGEQLAAGGDAINAFAFDWWRQVRGSQQGNTVVSPASIVLAFSMTHAGARGETAAEMSRAMRFEQLGERPWEVYGALLQRWRGNQGTELAIANRLFGERTYAFLQDYLALTEQHFGAPLEPVDFRNAADAQRQHINEWVAGQTRDKIRDLLPAGAILADTRLVLVNAIYFKGTWATQFNPSSTSDRPFSVTARQRRNVPMMANTDGFSHYVGDGVRVVQLPYVGDELAMVVVVPDRVDGLDAIEAQLDQARYGRWIAGLRPGQVEVWLPRFRVAPASSLRMRYHLVAMGMRLAWDDENADFSGMGTPPPPLYISQAFHKGFIEVNEEGTEAAAATAVVMARGGGAPMEPVAIHADRPFRYGLRDVRSGAILFMGRVADPSAQ